MKNEIEAAIYNHIVVAVNESGLPLIATNSSFIIDAPRDGVYVSYRCENILYRFPRKIILCFQINWQNTELIHLEMKSFSVEKIIYKKGEIADTSSPKESVFERLFESEFTSDYFFNLFTGGRGDIGEWVLSNSKRILL